MARSWKGWNVLCLRLSVPPFAEVAVNDGNQISETLFRPLLTLFRLYMSINESGNFLVQLVHPFVRSCEAIHRRLCETRHKPFKLIHPLLKLPHLRRKLSLLLNDEFHLPLHLFITHPNSPLRLFKQSSQNAVEQPSA